MDQIWSVPACNGQSRNYDLISSKVKQYLLVTTGCDTKVAHRILALMARECGGEENASK